MDVQPKGLQVKQVQIELQSQIRRGSQRLLTECVDAAEENLMPVDHMINDCIHTQMQGSESCYGPSFTVLDSLGRGSSTAKTNPNPVNESFLKPNHIVLVP